VVQLELVLQPPRRRRRDAQLPVLAVAVERQPVGGHAGVLDEAYAGEPAVGIGEPEGHRVGAPVRSARVPHERTLTAGREIR
jgi:hypothetical protein